MRTLVMFASAAALLAAATAQARDIDYKFASNPAFTATGSITVTAGAVSLPCNAVLHGTTTNGARFTSATFSGLSCAALTASGLPWPTGALAPHGAVMKNVTVNATVLGVCGPGNIHYQVNEAGVISISGAGLPGIVPCSVSGSLTTKPKLMIVPTKH